ncbi:MAG: COX15/CtaA family protein [Bacteroidetes bacterium]|nr:COX15/CtaA family protein [Bacteroidota bacterium]
MNLIKTEGFKNNKPVIIWLLSGCLLIYIMVLVGGLTRLTHSGLSITDWSFMGSVPPVNEKMWVERFEKYQQSPEFKKINFEMTLNEFKPIFWWEYVHRMIGRTMMYIFSIGLIYLLIKRKIKKHMLPYLGLLFFMGAMQAVIGWWMVYSGLQKQPAVSHYRLATHLMSAFMLFAFTFWFALKLIFGTDKNEYTFSLKKIKIASVVFFIFLILQIIYGAFTAGYVEGDNSKIRPGHIFNTWPKMGNTWIPEQVYMKNSLFENILSNPSGIQFVHRTIAVILVILFCYIWFTSSKMQLPKKIYQAITLLIYALTFQFILGVMTLVYAVPVILGALHQTGAFVLFSTVLYLLFQLFNTKTNKIG